MIILDERNHLEKELSAKGFEVFDFFENHQVLDMKAFTSLELKRRTDFLIVDTETVLKHPELQEKFKSLLNTFMGAVFFQEHSNEKADEWIKNEGAFMTKIIGQYSLPMAQVSWTILSNQLQFFWNLIEDQKKLQKHISQFSLELDQVLQSAETEMVKARKVHDSLVPRRSEEIRGVVFTNKYAAGEGGGSEFFDLLQTPSSVYQICISSPSYLISSALLGILSQHRDKDFNPAAFLKEAAQEIETINSAKKKKSEADILVLEIDLNTLMLKSHGSPKAELYSQSKGRVNLSKDLPYQTAKGEKLIVLSSGFLFNWKEAIPEQDVFDFLKAQSKLSSSELMSELFFKLKEKGEERFLKRDATVVMMEVNRHGIHKV